jgi:phage tail sheath protein FI
MTPGDKDAVLTAEQSKLDALKAMGALVGTPVVAFNAADNSTSDLMEGNFTWATQVTNVPLLKSATNTVAYNSDGLKDYLVQE